MLDTSSTARKTKSLCLHFQLQSLAFCLPGRTLSRHPLIGLQARGLYRRGALLSDLLLALARFRLLGIEALLQTNRNGARLPPLALTEESRRRQPHLKLWLTEHGPL